MSYLHIDNLYKNQEVLLFKEVYALEKIHGTSAHVKLRPLDFFSGGAKHEQFLTLFDQAALQESARAMLLEGDEAIVFGEAYGGKMQGMKDTYGPDLRFVAFDVKINGLWLTVPAAADFCAQLGLAFVPYAFGPATVEWLDEQRDQVSAQGVINGCGSHPREGIVIRPPIEVRKNNGARIIAKHKNDAFCERKTPQPVTDPAKLQVLQEAQAVGDEWVVPMRLEHVLQKLDGELGIERTKDVITAMLEDVLREAAGEVVDTREVRQAIGRAAAVLFKRHLQAALR